jgi:hypothetical protein
MLKKINKCQTPEELHHIGVEIDMSLADKSVKKPLYELIDAKMKTLNDIMAVSDNPEVSDLYEFYDFKE